MAVSLTPRDKVLNVLTYWWVIILTAIIGGLIGLVIFAVKQPVYEAQARFTIGIDYARSGKLTQAEEDIALSAAASVIFSPITMAQIAEIAKQENIPTDYETLKHMAVMERKASQWTLRVRTTDPDDAAFLTNQWVDIGMTALDEAYQHAIMAESLQDYIDSLENCLQQVSVNAVVPLCPYQTLADLENELRTAGDQMFQEKQASRNLFPGITYSLDQRAASPVRPALYGRSTLILAGILIGLLAGIAIVSMDLPNRLFERK